MTKRYFTKMEQEQLKCNPNVQAVSEKAITYTDEFKRHFIAENEKGKFPREIFENAGLDVELIGIKRIESSGKRWRASYRKAGVGGLQDTRKTNSGRPSERELTLEEKLKRLEAKNRLLEAENELLKKARSTRKADVEEEIKIATTLKFELIHHTMKKYKLKRLVSYLCDVMGISRSGYYNYFLEKSAQKRVEQEQADEVVKEIILKAYHFRGRKKGARQIKMTLENQYGITYNLKRIRRVMKKYQIICPIRKANPTRRMAKATKEHRTCPNELQRNFKQGMAGKVLLTDITYLTYGSSKRAYLSTIKDAETNEILAYEVSSSLSIDIALNTLHQLKKHRHLTEDAFIHSDQGFHYTNPQFQKLVKKMGLGQSMSRRGNCWDNAPQESFFGHFKDETTIEKCETLEEVKREIKSYMMYYNHYRGQWHLKKLPPAKYRQQLQQVT
ncbi:IS3 family transposase [Lysinibacillus boronitolerans]|uniref:IS3 family transposase n=1 Tax=Lysinibacillus boronitolerans TaxID=309788 RepID=UPI000313616A|nr:IS3 family transposase [Lysinibacillus boronitolerans]